MSDSSPLKTTIHSEMKVAMRAKDKPRLGVIRLIQSEFKRIEVDERIELDDARCLEILDKMLKQRRDSAKQYADAGRDDLASQENFEIDVIQSFMPQPFSTDEIDAMIAGIISETGAEGPQGMGKVMAILKPKLMGRADMAVASKQVKAQLTN